MIDKALVVLSGGQDSTTCLFWAMQNFDEVHAITFDYGQRHRIEIDAARKVAEMAGVTSHEVVEVPNCLAGTSFLTDLNAKVEEFENFEGMEHHNAFKESKLDSSFVPMRNSLFLTIAANRAIVLGASAIITGVTAADFAEYSDFSMEWLGGFVDAEGCFTTVNGTGYRLSISQKDPELFYRLGEWLKKYLGREDFTYSVSRSKDGCFEMYIGKQSLEMLMPALSPNLHSPHRRSQYTKVSHLPLRPENALTDAYCTGFWGGDGGIHFDTYLQKGKYETVRGHVGFYQKDPEVLEKISDHLGGGHLYQRKTQNRIWELRIGCGPRGGKLVKRLVKHICVLGSFEKITKAYHNVGMPAGGFNPPYPDCTPDYISTFQAMLEESLKEKDTQAPVVIAPVMFMTKAESVLFASSLPCCMEALAYSHTSYDGKYPPTGKNHANLLRAHGFEQAGAPDPLVVRAWREGLMELPETRNYNEVRNG